MVDSFKCPKCESTNVSVYHSTQTRFVYSDKEETGKEVIDVYEPYLIQCDNLKCQHSVDLNRYPDDTSFYMRDFIVAFVETDGGQFDGVSSKVMSGADAESVARARIAEVAAYYKEEYAKDDPPVVWEESLPGCYLEDEKEIPKIISGEHAYFRVFVFKLDGKSVDLDTKPKQD